MFQKMLGEFIHKEDGRWWAESPQIKNWTAFGNTFEECRKTALDGARHFHDAHIDVFSEINTNGSEFI